MLDYLNKEKLKTPEPDLDEDQVAEAMGTTISGTCFPDIQNINEVLITSNPSIEFVTEFRVHSLDDIRNELKKGLPVAVWIETGVVNYFHSVVITGINDIKKTISYNDPTYGKEFTISQSQFITKWGEYAYMVKTEIGRKTNYKLEHFMTQGSSDE